VASAAEPLASGALLGLLAVPAVTALGCDVAIVLLGRDPADTGAGEMAIGPTLRELERAAYGDPLDAEGPSPPPLGGLVWCGRPDFIPARDAPAVVDALRVLIEEAARGDDRLGPPRPQAGAGLGGLRLARAAVRTLRWPEHALRDTLAVEVARLLARALSGTVPPASTAADLDGSWAPWLEKLDYQRRNATIWVPPRDPPADASTLVAAAVAALLNEPARAGPVARVGGLAHATAFVRYIGQMAPLHGRSGWTSLASAASSMLAAWTATLGVGAGRDARGALQHLDTHYAAAAAGLQPLAPHERVLVAGGSASALRALSEHAVDLAEAARGELRWDVCVETTSGMRLRLATGSLSGDAPTVLGAGDPATLAAALTGVARSFAERVRLVYLAADPLAEPALLDWLAGARAPFRDSADAEPPWLRSPGTGEPRNLLRWPRDTADRVRPVREWFTAHHVQPALLDADAWEDPALAVMVGLERLVPLHDCPDLMRRLQRRVPTPGPRYVTSGYAFLAEQAAAWIEERWYAETGARWTLRPDTVALLRRPQLALRFLRAALVGLVRDDGPARVLALPDWPPLRLGVAPGWLSALQEVAAELPTSQRLGHPLDAEHIDTFTRELGTVVTEVERSPAALKRRKEQRDLSRGWWAQHEATSEQPPFYGTRADDEQVLLAALAADTDYGAWA
jgi:hypothetical protein